MIYFYNIFLEKNCIYLFAYNGYHFINISIKDEKFRVEAQSCVYCESNELDEYKMKVQEDLDLLDTREIYLQLPLNSIMHYITST